VFSKLQIVVVLMLFAANAFAFEMPFEQKQSEPKLYVFVSFSMPENSMKALIEQARKSQAILVFRGMHAGSLPKTTKKLLELESRGVSAIIDPKLFQKHNIESVPTFVLTRDNACENCSPFVDRMSGNVPLEYFLEEVVKSGDVRDVAKQYLEGK